MRHNRFRSHEVDVVTTLVLQIEHHLCEFVWLGTIALSQPTDLAVLAEDATQIAGTEEDGSRSAPATQATFLAGMGKMAAHSGVTPSLAYLGCIFEAVNVTLARAQDAVGQLFETKPDTACQFPRLPQLEISGLEASARGRERI